MRSETFERGAMRRDCFSARRLRKAGATIAAENGAPEHRLMAIFAWSAAKEAERYARRPGKKMAGDAFAGKVKGQARVSHPR